VSATTVERAELGRAARRRVTRSSQADCEPAPDRESPLAILARQDATRLPELLPIKYGRMVESPFAFYRGSAAVMAADLGSMASSELRVQLCGDAHLANFGTYASPDRTLVFDLNDFDETTPGPFEWDVKRLAASIEIAARHRGFRKRERVTAVAAAARTYREAMQQFAGMGRLAVWYLRMDERTLIAAMQSQAASAAAIKRVERGAAKARAKDNLRALARLTESDNGTLCFASRPPLLVPVKRARLLHPPAVGLEGVGRRRGDEARRARSVRAHLRLDARTLARALGRSGRDRRLPRPPRPLRPGDRGVRRALRRPGRARLGRAAQRRQGGSDPG
jgi:hypothetical protein